MIEIPLTQGKVALIDDEDWDLVSGYKWHASKVLNTYYARTRVKRADGSKTFLYMHRLLLGLVGRKVKADHRDGDGLNNRRENLRSCSHAENLRNRGAQVNNISGLKGVSWHKQSGKWDASIRVNGKGKHLGLFTTKEAAHAAYCRAAAELHGEFANYGSPN